MSKRRKEPERYWCKMCLRWLAHETSQCPLFPDAPGKKSSECSCLIHTCYDAKALGVKPDKKAMYRDFVRGE